MIDDAIITLCAAGKISPQIALARILLAGGAPEPSMLRDAAAERGGSTAVLEMARLADRHRDRFPALLQLAGAGLLPEGEDLLAATANLFDRLAANAPEAGVAFYSLGDADVLRAATAELTEVVRTWAPPARCRILDFGCGFGRLAIALAVEAADILGLDVSEGMIEEARRRAVDYPQLRFIQSNGRDLAPAADGSIDLLLAVDSLPYVIRANAIEEFMQEAVRVLAADGDLVVFNWSYRGDPDQDRLEAETLASRFGFAVLRAGEQPFTIWDGVGFHLRRSP